MSSLNRRQLLTGAGASLLAASVPVHAQQVIKPATVPPPSPEELQRTAWWRAARYGLFIHYGLYSVWGRQEWAVEKEAIPSGDWEKLAHRYNTKPGAPREWAKLAKAAGMKYMVFTAKHHEGFCNFDTKLTNYNSVQQGPKRDLVREYVDAARAEGMRVGIYYSLMDWHHPDGAKCSVDEEARKRFIEYTLGLIRELMTNYGKIDILWYDGGMPLDAKDWEAERMNKMVRELQPDILMNNRNHLAGDFQTPEQKIVAAANGHAWESCMTLNDSWGYDTADDNWKSPRTVLRNLISCARDGGNYLLNIGPMGDGTVPPASDRILREVGQWLEGNGKAIFDTDRCQPWRPNYAQYTRKGNTLYMNVDMWPGGDVSLSGLQVKVLNCHMMKGGTPLKFTQDETRVHITGLPEKAPDHPATTIIIECDGVPMMNTDNELRLQKPRLAVNITS